MLSAQGWRVGKKISKACALKAASSPHRPAAASCCENCLTQLHDNSRLFPRTFPKRNPLNHDKHTKMSKPIFANNKTQTQPPVEPLLHAPHNLWCRSAHPPRRVVVQPTAETQRAPLVSMRGQTTLPVETPLTAALVVEPLPAVVAGRCRSKPMRCMSMHAMTSTADRAMHAACARQCWRGAGEDQIGAR